VAELEKALVAERQKQQEDPVGTGEHGSSKGVAGRELSSETESTINKTIENKIEALNDKIKGLLEKCKADLDEEEPETRGEAERVAAEAAARAKEEAEERRQEEEREQQRQAEVETEAARAAAAAAAQPEEVEDDGVPIITEHTKNQLEPKRLMDSYKEDLAAAEAGAEAQQALLAKEGGVVDERTAKVIENIQDLNFWMKEVYNLEPDWGVGRTREEPSSHSQVINMPPPINVDEGKDKISDKDLEGVGGGLELESRKRERHPGDIWTPGRLAGSEYGKFRCWLNAPLYSILQNKYIQKKIESSFRSLDDTDQTWKAIFIRVLKELIDEPWVETRYLDIIKKLKNMQVGGLPGLFPDLGAARGNYIAQIEGGEYHDASETMKFLKLALKEFLEIDIYYTFTFPTPHQDDKRKQPFGCNKMDYEEQWRGEVEPPLWKNCVNILRNTELIGLVQSYQVWEPDGELEDAGHFRSFIPIKVKDQPMDHAEFNENYEWVRVDGINDFKIEERDKWGERDRGDKRKNLAKSNHSYSFYIFLDKGPKDGANDYLDKLKEMRQKEEKAALEQATLPPSKRVESGEAEKQRAAEAAAAAAQGTTPHPPERASEQQESQEEKEARERKEHERVQAEMAEAAERRKVRREVVKRAAKKLQATEEIGAARAKASRETSLREEGARGSQTP
ncbi:MAG: hypothetical protein MK240_10520, partial [Opitutales bacterium]|nr:hypothetical protein [Opitutales bacterium]